MKKGFTLIELLVVIAIIGLIAAIVLVNLQGTRGRGRAAAGKQFSSSLQNTLGNQAVGIWRFNEGSGSTAYDNSGYGNNGAITGAAWKATGECGLDLEGCLQLDGINDWVNIGDPSNGILDITGNLTISLWVNPSNVTGFRFFVSKNYLGEYELGLENGDLRWRQGDGIAYSPLGWAGFFSEGTNQWYHVAAVRDTSAGTITVYKNGTRFGAPQSYTVGAVASSYPLRLGRRGGGDLYFAGMMDDVFLYTTTLTTTEVQQLYAEGMERHLAEQ